MLVLVVGLWLGCIGSVRTRVPAQPADGLYDSEASLQPVSPVLRQAMAAMRKVTATAYYKTYYFRRETALTLLKFRMYQYPRLAERVVSSNRSKAGTAVILGSENSIVYMLTALHVVFFPDTQFTYYPDARGRPGPYLQSVSIKDYQRNVLTGLSGAGAFDIRNTDPKHDLALLAAPVETTKPPQAFPFPLGRAAELDWGVRVWVLGFPRGVAMATPAVVSSPNRDADHGFLVDALFNRGSSGSVVLAFRDGVEHTEWVGVITSVPARRLPVLVPDGMEASEGVEGLPYQGEVTISNLAFIDYGIAFGVPAEVVEKFLLRSGISFIPGGKPAK